MNKRIISFSLYGDLPLYTQGAIENAALVPAVYPGWTARFYVDDTVPKSVMTALATHGAEVERIQHPEEFGPYSGMYWRFLVAADESVERFIIRDADSRINTREAAAVADWIASGKRFHLMRDSIAHQILILGGMWGALGRSLPHAEQLIKTYGRFVGYGDDQDFLKNIVFPLMEGDYLCHDDRNFFGDAVPFPPHPPMHGTSYVGERVTDAVKATDLWRLCGYYREEMYLLQQSLQELRRERDTLLKLLATSEQEEDRSSASRW